MQLSESWFKTIFLSVVTIASGDVTCLDEDDEDEEDEEEEELGEKEELGEREEGGEKEEEEEEEAEEEEVQFLSTSSPNIDISTASVEFNVGTEMGGNICSKDAKSTSLLSGRFGVLTSVESSNTVLSFVNGI